MCRYTEMCWGCVDGLSCLVLEGYWWQTGWGEIVGIAFKSSFVLGINMILDGMSEK